MINLVLNFHNVNVNSAPQLTVPVAVDQFGDYVYQGGSYGDIEFPAQPQDHNAIDQFLGLKSSSEDTYSGGALPAPSSVTVSVLNGSGAYNQATTTSQSLQALGFHIGTIGDSDPVGQEAETVVYYAAKTPPTWPMHRPWRTPCRAPSSWPSTLPGEGGLPGHRRHRHRFHRQRSAHDHHHRPGRHRAQHHDDHVGQQRNTGNSGAFQAPTPTVEPLQPWDPARAPRAGVRARKAYRYCPTRTASASAAPARCRHAVQANRPGSSRAPAPGCHVPTMPVPRRRPGSQLRSGRCSDLGGRWPGATGEGFVRRHRDEQRQALTQSPSVRLSRRASP